MWKGLMWQTFSQELSSAAGPESLVRALKQPLAKNPENGLRRLAQLLPHLENSYVPVDAGEELPSLPVNLVTFLARGGEPLVAVACASGLLWVARARELKASKSLQVPGVGTGGRQIRGLAASNALRPFGEWSELMVVTVDEVPRGEEAWLVHRALVRLREGEIELRQVTDDAAAPSARSLVWPSHPLPAELQPLTRHVRFSSGADPFEPEVRRVWSSFLHDGPDLHRSRLIVGPGSAVLIEDGCHLKPHDADEPTSETAHSIRSAALLPSEGGNRRVILATEGRLLEGVELGDGPWRQLLHGRPIAVDGVPGAPSGAPSGDGWPDVLAALDDRQVVLYSWEAARQVQRLWAEQIDLIGRNASLHDPRDWLRWLRRQHDGRIADGSSDGAAARGLLYLLAADRVLTSGVGDSELCSGVSSLLADEVETAALLPAVSRMIEALDLWEKGDSPPALPAQLVWECYLKLPFQVQELIDANVLRVPEEKRRQLKEASPQAFGKLDEHSRKSLADLAVGPQPLQRLREAGLNVIRHVEPFVTGSVRLLPEEFGLRRLLPLTGRPEPWLAALGNRRAAVFTPEGQGPVEEDKMSVDLPPRFTIQVACWLPGIAGGLVLLGSRQGDLALWAPFDGSRPLRHLKRLDGPITAADPVPPLGGLVPPGSVLVGCETPAGGRFHLLSIAGFDAAWELQEVEAPVHHLRAFTVVASEGRHRVLAADGEDLVLLEGDLVASRRLSELGRRSLGTRVRAVNTLAQPGLPLQLVAATQDGQVISFLMDLDRRAWRRAQWVYQLRRGVQSLAADGLGRFCLALSGGGEVVLLDVAGHRHLRHRTLDRTAAAVPILRGGGGEGSIIVLGTELGRILVLRQTDQALALISAQESLVNGSAKEEWTDQLKAPKNEAGELGWMLGRSLEGESAAELYPRLRFRGSRHALADLAAHDTARAFGNVEDLSGVFSLRDLAHFLRRRTIHHLQQHARAAWQRLVEYRAQHEHKDDGPGAAGALLYELLRLDPELEQRLAGEQVPRLPRHLLTTEWVSRLVALHVVGELPGEIGVRKDLLEPLLQLLVRYPLTVAGSAASLVGGSDSQQPVVTALRAFSRLDGAVARGVAAEIDSSLAELARALKSWKEDRGEAGRLARLLLLISCDREGDGDDDDEEVERRWEDLTSLVDDAKGAKTGTALRQLLFDPLAEWLPGGRPEGWQSLGRWEEWLREARERAHTLLRRAREEDLAREEREPWASLCSLLNRRGLEELHELVRERERRLRSEPHLSLDLGACRRRSPREVEGEIEARLQGQRSFQRVRFKLDLSREGGLGATDGPLVWEDEQEVVAPDREGDMFRFPFRGAAATDQESLAIHAELAWEGHAPLGAIHFLRLPRRRREQQTPEAPLPRELPESSARLRRRLEEVQHGVVVLLLDEEIGGDGFLATLEGTDVFLVDLDGALRACGPGRTYPRLLTAERLLATIEAKPVKGSGPRTVQRCRRVIVHPADDALFRLLSDPDLRQEAQQFLHALRGRTSQGFPLVLVLGSQVGGLLRRHVGDGIPFLAGHQLDLTDPEVRSETIRWLADGRRAAEQDALSHAVELLAGDLRLVERLRGSLRRSPITPYDYSLLTALLESHEVEQLLQADLAGLEPNAIQLLMVAACATTSFPFQKVPVGLVSAETVSSTVRHGKTGKVLLRTGERVDGAVATRLSSDLGAQRRTFRAEGFAVTGGAVSTEALRSLALLLGDAERIQALGRTLAARGVVELAGPVVRSLAPFGPLIRGLVESGSSAADVYRRLTGLSSPLETLPLAELSRLSADAIREIEPTRSLDQARMLARLGESWHALRSRRSVPIRTLRLAMSTLTGTEVDLVTVGEEEAASGLHDTQASAWDGSILFSLRSKAGRASSEHYLLLVPPQASLSASGLQQLRSQIRPTSGNQPAEGTLFLLLRPLRAAEPEPTGWIEIHDHELQAAAYHEEPSRAFWSTVRAKAGPADLNPFKVGSALPPGSPMFFGRETERDLVLSRIRDDCFLVVGGRQVGKTSFKNRVLFELQKEPDLELLELDGQGARRRDDLLPQLRRYRPATETETAIRTEDLLVDLVDTAHRSGCFPILIFNEIDTLVIHDPDFLWQLRRLHEGGRARFLFVGYLHHAAAACNDPDSALYRWTSAPGGAPYITLAELSEDAARNLVDVLEQPPLALTWESREQKEQALRLIMGRTYRIPLLIQLVCKRLVQRVLDRRRFFLRYDDVLAVLKEGGLSALENIGKYDPEKILPQLPKDVADDFIDLALAVAARRIYFEGPEPLIEDPDLLERDARLTTFTANDVVDWLLETFPRVLLPREVEVARRRLEEIHMRKLLLALTLTPILSLIPPGERFFFQLHLYPREVYLQLKTGDTIDDRILQRLLSFSRYLSGQLRARVEAGDPLAEEEG